MKKTPMGVEADIATKPAKAKTKATTASVSVKETGLTVSKKVNGTIMKFDDALPAAKTLIANGLQQLTACVAMADLKPPQLRDLFDYSKGVEDAVKEASGFARARVLELALSQGEPSGASGESRKLVYPDGRTQLIKAQKTGTDPKKFEAAIRSKNIPIEKYMVPEIKYKMPTDYDAAKQVVDDGVFTADEVKLMAYDPSFAVERSKEGKGE